MAGYDSIYRSGLFDGRVALVTGGGSGIGRAIAHELAHLGARVVISGRNREKLDTVVDEIVAQGGHAEAVVFDIRDEAAVDAAVAGIVARYGGLHCLVNNAGGQFVAGAEEIRPKGWRAVVDTNLNGTFWVTRAAFDHHMGEHGGAIVSIVADMWNGFPGMAHTGAARAGVEFGAGLGAVAVVATAARGARDPASASEADAAPATAARVGAPDRGGGL